MKKIKALVTLSLILLVSFCFVDSQEIQIKKIAYNPNAADYSGFGYGDIPVYVPPIDPAPGLVQVGPDLLPNFQVSDDNFSGTCVPGDTITFYVEVFNGYGGTMAVQVEDVIPIGMINAAVAAPGVIVDTSGDAIIGNGGDTVVWNLPALSPGYTLLTYQADVLADGSVNFGDAIINDGPVIYYEVSGDPMSLQAPTVTILVEAAQLIKEAFQDLACTIPAPSIAPESRLYYRLTAFNTIDPLSPIPYTALATDITDAVPPLLTDPQYHVSPPGMAPQPIVGNTVSWQGVGTPIVPGASISGIYSTFVPIGAAGLISNNAQLTYTVNFPPPGGTSVTTTSNTAETQVGTATFDGMATLFASNTFWVAGNNAYCTDVLGCAKIAYGLAVSGVTVNPDGRTDIILTTLEHDTGNLIPVGGPAINPVATEFDGYFGITYDYQEGVSFEIFSDGYSIFLDLSNYPQEDICIVYMAEQSGRNVMLVWGYGWQGTYAGSVYIGDPATWTAHTGDHMLMMRWIDSNADGLIQMSEIIVEQSN